MLIELKIEFSLLDKGVIALKFMIQGQISF